jgi:hypothetical protein
VVVVLLLVEEEEEEEEEEDLFVFKDTIDARLAQIFVFSQLSVPNIFSR